MNEKISWDHTLIKKYSSSNHFKLLNQLRTEVKKYPLNKNKNSHLEIENNFDSKNNNSSLVSHQLSQAGNSIQKQEINKDISTVSFNNSKNFSIYNNSSNDSSKEQHETNRLNVQKTIEDSISVSFKDRLNQIDMK